jgi:hypothetical protein
MTRKWWLEDGKSRMKRGETNLENIKRHAGLRAQGVLVRPHAGKTRHVEIARAHVVQLRLERNVVLLQDGEAGAQHGHSDEATQQLRRQLGVPALPHGVLQQTDQLDAGAVDRVPLADGDELCLVPGQLLEGADHALEGPLRAFAGERRLVPRCQPRQGNG